MSLPSLVEYIASLERPDGGALALQAAQQFVVPAYPANTTAFYNIAPPSDQYAAIAYTYNLGNMEPDVFSYNITQTGANVLTGIISLDIITRGAEFFVVVTNSNPLYVYITNRDIVPHTWEATMYYLMVATIDDLQVIRDALADYGGAGTARAMRKINEAIELGRGEAPPPQSPSVLAYLLGDRS
jgi:hypothetical protein